VGESLRLCSLDASLADQRPTRHSLGVLCTISFFNLLRASSRAVVLTYSDKLLLLTELAHSRGSVWVWPGSSEGIWENLSLTKSYPLLAPRFALFL